MRLVINFIKQLRENRKLTLGELIDDCFGNLPSEVMDELPADASLNLNHYLYGNIKKILENSKSASR